MQKVYCHPPDHAVVFRQEGDGGLLFNVLTEQFKTINSTGVFIWRACKKGNTVQNISNEARKRYRVNKSIVTKEIQLFLADLVKNGFMSFK